MTVTVEIVNHGTLNLLKELENLGLIHVQPSSPQKKPEIVEEEPLPYQWLRGCCKNIPGGSVDDFLASSREEKEYELTIEKHQQEESERLAREKLSP